MGRRFETRERVGTGIRLPKYVRRKVFDVTSRFNLTSVKRKYRYWNNVKTVMGYVFAWEL